MKVPLGSPPPALGSAKKVTEVRRDENMQARTGGKTLDGHQVISFGCYDKQIKGEKTEGAQNNLYVFICLCI